MIKGDILVQAGSPRWSCCSFLPLKKLYKSVPVATFKSFYVKCDVRFALGLTFLPTFSILCPLGQPVQPEPLWDEKFSPKIFSSQNVLLNLPMPNVPRWLYFPPPTCPHQSAKEKKSRKKNRKKNRKKFFFQFFLKLPNSSRKLIEIDFGAHD